MTLFASLALAADPAVECVRSFADAQRDALVRNYTGCLAWRRHLAGTAYEPSALADALVGDLGKALLAADRAAHPEHHEVPAACLWAAGGDLLLCRALAGDRAFPITEETDLVEAATHPIELLFVCVPRRTVALVPYSSGPIRVDLDTPPGPTCGWALIDAITLVPARGGQHTWEIAARWIE